jgi:hypothetical protein
MRRGLKSKKNCGGACRASALEARTSMSRAVTPMRSMRVRGRSGELHPPLHLLHRAPCINGGASPSSPLPSLLISSGGWSSSDEPRLDLERVGGGADVVGGSDGAVHYIRNSNMRHRSETHVKEIISDLEKRYAPASLRRRSAWLRVKMRRSAFWLISIKIISETHPLL